MLLHWVYKHLQCYKVAGLYFQRFPVTFIDSVISLVHNITQAGRCIDAGIES